MGSMALGGNVGAADIPIGIAFFVCAFLLISITVCYRREEGERME